MQAQRGSSNGLLRRRGHLGPLVLVLVIGVVPFLAVKSSGAATPTFTITPTTGLVDGQTVSVTASNIDSGVTYVIVECGPVAYALLGGHGPDGDRNPEDGCDAQSAYIRFTGDGSTVHADVTVHVILNAAVGPIDCRTEQCFIALFPLAGSAPTQPENITFGANACAAAGSCVVGTRPGVAGRTSPEPARATPAPPTVATATAGSPVSLAVTAGLAGDLTAIGAVTGEVTGAFGAPDVPASPVSGEGIVRLDLAAPGTDWGANTPSSIVVDVSVDGGTPQQMVLFNGATPFVYAGGVGALATGPHTVVVAIDAALSHPGVGPATVDVHDVALEVVAPGNPRYAAIHYAPILWGRSTSALHDTPLIEYASTTTSASGTTAGYTMAFSHENAGTAFIPFLESAVWGRTTDIESFFNVTTDAGGTPTGGSFLSGATPDGYRDSQTAINEPTVAYTSGVWVGGSHGVLRVATGNNDFSQNGTTPFRFRPVPVAAPAPGQPREAVMDANPWTYRIAGEEVARWYTNFTTDPMLPEQGDARQYAYVQLDSTGASVDRVAVDVRIAGDPTWYASDFGSGYNTGGTGVDRTVIKLPTDWLSRGIEGVRIRVFPGTAATALDVSSLRVLGLDQTWGLHLVSLPEASIVSGFLFVMPTPPPVTTSTTLAPGTSTPPRAPAAPEPTVPTVSVAPVAPPAAAVSVAPTYTG
ncbi:MAG: hypothetical protein JST73_07695 [Actinobacteria bacterium]|nr:hypothetical protein [Actinomycetota bacterium]